MNNNDLMTNGVLDLGKLREQKENEAKEERFKALAAQIQPIIYAQGPEGQELEFEVVLSAVTEENVLLMLRRATEDPEAEDFQHWFAAIAHDGEKLGEEMRTMDDEEFAAFYQVIQAYIPASAEVQDEDEGEDDPATLGTLN